MTEKNERSAWLQEDLFSIRMRAFSGERHLSGGEDLVGRGALAERLLALTEQGLNSTRNTDRIPPSLNIRIEPVEKDSVVRGTLLPVHCLESSSHQETVSFLSATMETIGRREAIDPVPLWSHFRRLIEGSEEGLSGASFLFPGGDRWIPEGRGVRVTHFGILPSIRQSLLEEANQHPSGSGRRFIDALQIASKIQSFPSSLLEICISDNPEYTTGYMAIRNFGYLRLPHIKSAGDPSGGRLILLSKELDEEGQNEVVSFLSRTPVLFTERSQLFSPSTGKTLLGKLLQRGDMTNGKPGIS